MMAFSSVAFILFVIAVFVVYFQIPHKFRYILLVFANLTFYGSFGSLYLITLLYMALASWGIGILLERPAKKSGPVMCFIALLLPLFIYKYLSFTIHSVDRILSLVSIPASIPEVKMIYPIGISFYTFESLSYVIDVYKKRIKAERNFFKILIYISFFPNVISGPIERAGDFLPQLDIERKFDYDRAVYGFRLMLTGLFKKIVCADYLAVLADSVFDRVVLFKGPVFIVAVIVYTFQIYLDFSGYTDIARGIAHALGFDLRMNFKAPYLSGSIKEFFSRWHISLSAWLRDYIYIPLGGSRKGKAKKYRNLLITFFVSGLWHGANYTFIVWGLLHGVYQVAGDVVAGIIGGHRQPQPVSDVMWQKNSSSEAAGIPTSESGEMQECGTNTCRSSGNMALVIKKLLSIGVTFALVSFAWLFFRVNSLGEASYILKNMFTLDNFSGQMAQMGFVQGLTYLAVAGIIIFTIAHDILLEKIDMIEKFGTFKLPVRWLTYIAMITLIITMRTHIGADASFIYFSF